ncbi:AEC family transporter [Acuticoccus sp. 2012]|uniref:AEC family transporter n=2 Tax=Acuticoccus mangrovi TaxID=2796142 RepID=A0A934MKQ2_9HYPH|nr:AEC family transporter [Acuticoccus mangrovi]MBJ3775664.1 AEC family transporter [Acuticoccus mangrovi]
MFLAIGVVLNATGRMPENASKVLGAWVINVALPATALHSVHGITFDPGWAFAALTPWIGVALAIVVFAVVGRAAGWSRQRVGGLVLVAGFGNTSFVGLPMIAAFAGTQWLPLGLVIDLFGSYLALSTVGLVVATVCSRRTISAGAILRRIGTFPPFIAIVLALATNHLGRPALIDDGLAALSATMTPVALAAVGCALRFDRLAGMALPITAALVFRLLVAPAALLGLYFALVGAGSAAVRDVTILEMAMPPMLGATIIALEYDLDSDLVALVIGLGIPLSLLTTALWWHLLSLV